jgi:hypothetical protein
MERSHYCFLACGIPPVNSHKRRQANTKYQRASFPFLSSCEIWGFSIRWFNFSVFQNVAQFIVFFLSWQCIRDVMSLWLCVQYNQIFYAHLIFELKYINNLLLNTGGRGDYDMHNKLHKVVFCNSCIKKTAFAELHKCLRNMIIFIHN